MKNSFLVIQHVDWENPGRLLLDSARKLSVDLHIVKIWEESLPDGANFDALLLLGGPPNVNEEEKYPFLKAEKHFIQSWLATNKPCLGFCLGHQLLADAFDADVGLNFMTSVGFIEGQLTDAGKNHPLFAEIPEPLSLFKWHGQAVQTPLPEDFILLATSDECKVEAFTIKNRPHIIGMQCDNHAADPEDVRHWAVKDQEWLSKLPPEQVSPQALANRAQESLSESQAMFTQLFSNFVSIVNESKRALGNLEK